MFGDTFGFTTRNPEYPEFLKTTVPVYGFIASTLQSSYYQVPRPDRYFAFRQANKLSVCSVLSLWHQPGKWTFFAAGQRQDVYYIPLLIASHQMKI